MFITTCESCGENPFISILNDFSIWRLFRDFSRGLCKPRHDLSCEHSLCHYYWPEMKITFKSIIMQVIVTYLMTKGYGVLRADSPAWSVTASADWSFSWWSWKFSLLNCMTSWPHLSKSNSSWSKSKKGYLHAFYNIKNYFLSNLLH